MKRLKDFAIRILHPGVVWIIVLTLLSASALIYIFTSERHETFLAYIFYALAAYSVTAFSVNIQKIVAKVNSFVMSKKIANRVITDMSLQIKLSLYLSLSLNVFYAAFKLLAGIRYASFWYGADALFYVVLSAVRFLLLRHMRNERQNPANELRKYRFCGCLLFALSAAFTGVVYQVANQNMGYEYPGLLVYVVATYTFANLVLAVVNLVKFRKKNSPALSAVKIISFVRALVAIFALQTAMFASFGDGAGFQRIMNIAFGVCVCCTIFYLAVTMVIHANKKLKKLSTLII